MTNLKSSLIPPYASKLLPVFCMFRNCPNRPFALLDQPVSFGIKTYLFLRTLMPHLACWRKEGNNCRLSLGQTAPFAKQPNLFWMAKGSCNKLTTGLFIWRLAEILSTPYCHFSLRILSAD